VKVINNNLKENKQEPETTDEPARPPTSNRRSYAENSFSHNSAFDTKVPANSRAMLFTALEVWTETSTDNRPPRPKAADPRNRVSSVCITGLVDLDLEPSGPQPLSHNFQQDLEKSLTVQAQTKDQRIVEPRADKTEKKKL
jgi:hypothetical protein